MSKKNRKAEAPKEEPMTATLEVEAGALESAQAELANVKLELQKAEKEAAIEDSQVELDKIRLELLKAKEELEEKRTEIRLSAKRDLDDKECDMTIRKINMGNEMAAKRAELEKQKAYDDQLVTGKFINMRAPGQPVKLPYMKYNTDLPKWWDLQHNKVYTIPRGFADQINNHYAKIEHIQKTDDIIKDPTKPGTALEEHTIRHQLYSFVPVSF